LFPVGEAVSIAPAEPEATIDIPPPVTAVPPISKESAAVPVIVA
jgi:hypothetical protein